MSLGPQSVRRARTWMVRARNLLLDRQRAFAQVHQTAVAENRDLNP